MWKVRSVLLSVKSACGSKSSTTRHLPCHRLGTTNSFISMLGPMAPRLSQLCPAVQEQSPRVSPKGRDGQDGPLEGR